MPMTEVHYTTFYCRFTIASWKQNFQYIIVNLGELFFHSVADKPASRLTLWFGWSEGRARAKEKHPAVACI